MAIRNDVVGEKAGFLTKTFEVIVVGGASASVAVDLAPLGETARIEHRWSAWIPWVVCGSGFAVIGAGALLAQRGVDRFRRPDVDAASGVDGHDQARLTGQFAAVDRLLTVRENLRLMADLRHLGRDAGRRRVEELAGVGAPRPISGAASDAVKAASERSEKQKTAIANLRKLQRKQR